MIHNYYTFYIFIIHYHGLYSYFLLYECCILFLSFLAAASFYTHSIGFTLPAFMIFLIAIHSHSGDITKLWSSCGMKIESEEILEKYLFLSSFICHNFMNNDIFPIDSCIFRMQNVLCFPHKYFRKY